MRPRPRYALPQSRAHPRSRGEHQAGVIATAVLAGSSPLARGTLVPGAGAGRIAGLIPARAGNTVWLSSCRACVWAHPRSRGEHDAQSHGDIIESGSSPLARGTHQLSTATARQSGLIPARAGNTLRLSGRSECLWAHPRSRGEHYVTEVAAGNYPGSSPLARGTPSNIPANVGGIVAHPRSRGEHRGLCRAEAGCRWLIPARAGNTWG